MNLTLEQKIHLLRLFEDEVLEAIAEARQKDEDAVIDRINERFQFLGDFEDSLSLEDEIMEYAGDVMSGEHPLYYEMKRIIGGTYRVSEIANVVLFQD